jgi:hypothetical protein
MPGIGALSALLQNTSLLILVVSLWTALVLIATAWILLATQKRASVTSTVAAVLLLAAAVVVPLAIRTYEYGWIAGLSILALAIIGIIATVKPGAALPKQVSAIIVTLCIGISLSVSLGSEHIAREETAGDSTLAQVQTNFSRTSERVLRSARELSELSSARDILSAERNRVTELSSSLLQDMRKSELDFLTILDTNGTVITRAHQPSDTAGKPLQEAPWAASVVSDQQATGGRAILDENQPSLAAAAPILDQGIVRGILITGIRINESYLANSASEGGVAIAATQGVTAFTATTPLARAIYQSAALDEALRNDIHQATTSNFRYTVTVDTASYTVEGAILSTLTNGAPMAIVAATILPTPGLHPIFAGIIGLLMGLIFSVLLFFSHWKQAVFLPILTSLKHRGGSHA